MSSLRKKTKLSAARNPTSKSASTKNTNLRMREDTLFRKASQLAKLCEIDVCIIYFRQNGELKLWPEEPKVREMAEKYMKLSEKERMKKSTNIFVVSKNKLLHQFSEKQVTEMEDSLISHLKIVEPEFFGVDNDLQAEPDQNPVVPSDLFLSNGQHLMSHMTSGSTSDISSSVFTHPHHHQQQFMNCVVTSGTEQSSETESPYNHHDNSSCYYQNPNSVSTFDDPLLPLPSYDDMSMGSTNYIDDLWNDLNTTQQFGLNIDLLLLPPQMQTQIPLDDHFASWSHQTTDPLMFSYN